MTVLLPRCLFLLSTVYRVAGMTDDHPTPCRLVHLLDRSQSSSFHASLTRVCPSCCRSPFLPCLVCTRLSILLSVSLSSMSRWHASVHLVVRLPFFIVSLARVCPSCCRCRSPFLTCLVGTRLSILLSVSLSSMSRWHASVHLVVRLPFFIVSLARVCPSCCRCRSPFLPCPVGTRLSILLSVSLSSLSRWHASVHLVVVVGLPFFHVWLARVCPSCCPSPFLHCLVDTRLSILLSVSLSSLSR